MRVQSVQSNNYQKQKSSNSPAFGLTVKLKADSLFPLPISLEEELAHYSNIKSHIKEFKRDSYLGDRLEALDGRILKVENAGTPKEVLFYDDGKDCYSSVYREFDSQEEQKALGEITALVKKALKIKTTHAKKNFALYERG